MPDVLAPVDIEPAVVALLDAGMAADVATTVENPRPARCVRVTALGGTGSNLIQALPRVLVECWAEDQTTAFDVARTAWGLLWAAQHSFLAAGVWVADIASTQPVNFPDPDTESPRFQFIATIRAAYQEVTS